MLRSGGNAVDAAIACAAVLGVVEPEQSGIGGDCFVLICPAGGDVVYALDGAGWSPLGATAGAYAKLGLKAFPQDGPHSVTVPGAVAAWFEMARRFGRKPWDELLEDAIRYADRGHPVHERVAFDWDSCSQRLRRDAVTADIFLPGGVAPKAGELFRQPLLAETLRRIASLGRAGFYEGPVAEDIVNCLSMQGGFHTLADFAEYRSRWVEPLHIGYRGLQVYQCPPPGQGFAALLLLQAIEACDDLYKDPLDPARLHFFAEATKLVYQERDRIVGDDPDAYRLACAALAGGTGAALTKHIDPHRASTLPYPDDAAGETVFVSVVDRERTVVSLISSVYKSYGSAMTAPVSGVVLQNRGAGFSLTPGRVNSIGPRRRPFHTIMPGLVLRDGKPFISFGMVGGHYQPVGQAWLLSNIVDHRLDPQAAIDLPRAFAFGNNYRIEAAIPASVESALVSLGHTTERWPIPIGSAQAILIDWDQGTLVCGSDGRTDGCALGY
jgi:gamma-glutamyltranspeptidase/glutathione hydrolase